ncbi:hypothetical protein OGAPHI_003532 [Ogataea philodendri]|uniref:mRNA export factor MEX67 n=1 Tax=Ogataea philodendri TaxID=1378263 RepID=A0A9P8P7N8_9ASCO|nr:uncharacterized protein OGAPHI_003532 [Ogataea philodendri]KAH3666535.1 hypothetical protein OGAPHI_003532 [Ogataea philodendri]
MFQSNFGLNQNLVDNRNYSASPSNQGFVTTNNAERGTVVEVTGWTNANEKDLVSFIHRKTKINLKIVNADRNSGVLTASVKSEKDANILVKYNGIRFAGESLKINIVSAIDSSKSNNTVTLIKNILASRYDPGTMMLNLDGLRNGMNPEFQGLFATTQTASKFFLALMKIASQQQLKVESLNLSNNDLGNSQKDLIEVAVSFPTLKNLALSNNNITKIETIEKLKNKLPYLRELWIVGNPIDSPSFSSDIIKCFPRLSILNGVPVRDEGKLTNLLSFPFPCASSFFESPELQSVAIQFITTYLNFWDNDRMSLLNLFTPESQFSYHFDTTHIVEASSASISIKDSRTPNSVASSWGSYISNSRNLMRVSGIKSRMSKVFKGRDPISDAFQSLPTSKHRLDKDPSSYSIEVVSVPILNAMEICVHGSFVETGSPKKSNKEGHFKNGSKYTAYHTSSRSQLSERSFDRSLLVIAGTGGSYIVASDMLLLKQYSGQGGWSSDSHRGPVSSSPAASGLPVAQAPSSAIPADIVSKLSLSQQQILNRVFEDTKLTPQYSIMLCEQSNWDYNTAMINFNNSRAQIPKDAFL